MNSWPTPTPTRSIGNWAALLRRLVNWPSAKTAPPCARCRLALGGPTPLATSPSCRWAMTARFPSATCVSALTLRPEPAWFLAYGLTEMFRLKYVRVVEHEGGLVSRHSSLPANPSTEPASRAAENTRSCQGLSFVLRPKACTCEPWVRSRTKKWEPMNPLAPVRMAVFTGQELIAQSQTRLGPTSNSLVSENHPGRQCPAQSGSISRMGRNEPKRG